MCRAVDLKSNRGPEHCAQNLNKTNSTVKPFEQYGTLVVFYIFHQFDCC